MDIVTTSNFHARLLPGQLDVLFIPAAELRLANWGLLQLLLFDSSSLASSTSENEDSSTGNIHQEQARVFSIVMDTEGATLFLDRQVDTHHLFGEFDSAMQVAPSHWRAIEIHLGPLVAEFPGIVSFLSKILAQDDISILNMRYRGSEIFISILKF